MDYFEMEIKRGNAIQKLIEGIKPNLGKRVKAQLLSDRFPYTYAYDFERLGSRSDTGTYLRGEFNEDVEGYAKEIISRAFSYLLREYADDFLFDILDEAEVRETYIFIRDNYYINMNA